MRIALALALSAALGACVGPPPSHALVVRHLALKCALIAFSGCAAFASEDEDRALELDDDAGVD